MSAPIRVAIDAHTLGRRATGNETYVRSLLEALTERHDIHPIALVDPGAAIPHSLARNHRLLGWKHPIPRLMLDLASPRRKWGAQLLHVQYIRPPMSDVPIVTTVHDISFEHFPAMFTLMARARMRALIPWSARRSRAVLTGSAYSRMDLIERYGLSEDRVWVTPYAADARFRLHSRAEIEAVLERLRLPHDYVLCVGNLQPRKNLPRLLDAYAQLSNTRPPLVVVGQRAWLHSDVFSSLRRLAMADQIHLTGYVAGTDLPALYSGALAFVYPSLFEGFGLPILEAMASGAPTVASNTSSIPEVAGNAAIQVDPTDVDAIAEALDRVISSESLRATMRKRGFRQAAQFSWDRCAEATLTAYHAAVQ